jgi:hypothetical protein
MTRTSIGDVGCCPTFYSAPPKKKSGQRAYHCLQRILRVNFAPGVVKMKTHGARRNLKSAGNALARLTA